MRLMGRGWGFMRGKRRLPAGPDRPSPSVPGMWAGARQVTRHGGQAVGLSRPAERALTRFRRGGETAAQRAGDSTRRAANRRRWRDERIAAQRAARGLWHEAQRGEADQAGEDHVISGHELVARPADQRARSEEHTSELQSLMRRSYA